MQPGLGLEEKQGITDSVTSLGVKKKFCAIPNIANQPPSSLKIAKEGGEQMQ